MADPENELRGNRFLVPTEFEGLFTHFYGIHNRSDEPFTKSLLPTFQTIILFCFGENAFLTTHGNVKVEVEKCVVFGPIKQAFEYTLPANGAILVANFKNDAFYRFFGRALIDQDLPTNPDELLNENCFTALWHQLDKMNSTTERIDYILHFCKPYLRSQTWTSSLLSNFKEEKLDPIKAIAAQTNQTTRNVQLKQKEQFGYSLKERNRFHRFLNAIHRIDQQLSKSKKVEWFDIIQACNYYDQSQLIHDFQHFMHLSPKQYLQFQEGICNPLSKC